MGTLDIWMYFLSLLVLFVAQFYVVVLWRFIVNSGKNKIGIKDAISIFYLSALGRYIPGKVWQLVGLAMLSEGAGIESEIAITSSLLSQSLSVITGFLISAGTITLYVKWYFVIPLILLVLVFLYPPVFNKVLNFFSMKIRKKSLSMNISLVQELLLFLGYWVAWLLYGLSLFLLFKAFSLNIGLVRSIQFFAVSYLLGLFAVFVPGGLGVREGVLTLLLEKTGIATYLGSMISIFERLNITLTEIILGLFGLFAFLLKRKS